MIFDFEDNTITVDGYDLFVDLNGRTTSVDLVIYGADGTDSVLTHFPKLTLPGRVLRIDLSEYGIHMIRVGDKVYIPLQTFNDLFVSFSFYNWAWNGEALFEVSADMLVEETADGYSRLSALGSLYYAPERKGQRPSDLILFTYRELCLALGIHYGLKAEHGIGTFNEYFIRTGLAVSLLSGDPEVFYQAISDLTDLHFADNHSITKLDSPFGDPFRHNTDSAFYRMTDVDLRYSYYVILRAEVTGSKKGADGYSEFGDTAFIAFDDFSIHYDVDYMTCELKNDPTDTVMLILYAHQQITRENSPIRYVVIDLSCNGGGDADAAAAVIAWFLTVGTIQIENTLTMEKGVVMYKLDANRDGMIDSNDFLPSNVKRFCIISGASFSCGNLVPYAFRASDEVILIGRKSGGGACAVQPLITADGLLFQCSGHYRLSTVTNGSFSSVDAGVTPDFVLTDMSMVYNREDMADCIRHLQ